jgi:hypothetical protein
VTGQAQQPEHVGQRHCIGAGDSQGVVCRMQCKQQRSWALCAWNDQHRRHLRAMCTQINSCTQREVILYWPMLCCIAWAAAWIKQAPAWRCYYVAATLTKHFAIVLCI